MPFTSLAALLYILFRQTRNCAMEAEVDTWTRGQKEAEDAMLYNSQS